jgi:hypothetical protein
MCTDGACSFLSFAAKRSGAFPPSMLAGLRARVSSRQFHEAVLRVIASPSWGSALCHHGRSGYQPLSLDLNPDGVLVCTV